MNKRGLLLPEYYTHHFAEPLSLWAILGPPFKMSICNRISLCRPAPSSIGASLTRENQLEVTDCIAARLRPAFSSSPLLPPVWMFRAVVSRCPKWAKISSRQFLVQGQTAHERLGRSFSCGTPSRWSAVSMETTKDAKSPESDQGSNKPLAAKPTWGERVKATRIAVSFACGGMISVIELFGSPGRQIRAS